MMKQITVKTAEQALDWMHKNPHHEVGTIYGADGQTRTHIFVRNHFEIIRIPERLVSRVFRLTQPNHREFDSRMYALTKHGRAVLRKWKSENQGG